VFALDQPCSSMEHRSPTLAMVRIRMRDEDR
jgi:hypothetical protein